MLRRNFFIHCRQFFKVEMYTKYYKGCSNVYQKLRNLKCKPKCYENGNVRQMLQRLKCIPNVTNLKCTSNVTKVEMYIKCYKDWNIHSTLRKLKSTSNVTNVHLYISNILKVEMSTKCYKLTVIFKCISNESKPKYYSVVSVSALTMFIQIWMDLGVF